MSTPSARNTGRPEKLTKAEILRKLKGVPKESQKAVVCALIGHSNILDGCFGYMHCGRCEALVGDTLAGAYSNDKCVIIRHNCQTCRANYKKMDWRDKWMVIDPFKKEETR